MSYNDYHLYQPPSYIHNDVDPLLVNPCSPRSYESVAVTDHQAHSWALSPEYICETVVQPRHRSEPIISWIADSTGLAVPEVADHSYLPSAMSTPASSGSELVSDVVSENDTERHRPHPTIKTSAKRRRKRSPLTDSQRVAHNIIEKKYRASLNNKHRELFDLIDPNWRTRSVADASKPNKSIVLESACLYIRHLVGERQRLLTALGQPPAKAFAPA